MDWEIGCVSIEAFDAEAFEPLENVFRYFFGFVLQSILRLLGDYSLCYSKYCPSPRPLASLKLRAFCAILSLVFSQRLGPPMSLM